MCVLHIWCVCMYVKRHKIYLIDIYIYNYTHIHIHITPPQVSVSTPAYRQEFRFLLHFGSMRNPSPCWTWQICRDSPAARPTLLPTSTMGMFSHTRTMSLCQLGTFWHTSNHQRRMISIYWLCLYIYTHIYIYKYMYWCYPYAYWLNLTSGRTWK